MTATRKEQLEMAGYQAGRRTADDRDVCYNNSAWSDEEREAYRRGWKSGREMAKLLAN